MARRPVGRFSRILGVLRPSVALAIVAVSVLGAVAGFLSTRAGGVAAVSGARALADLTVREEIAAVASTHASSDLRAYALFEESQRLASAFERQAERLAPSPAAMDMRREARFLRSLLSPDLFIHDGPLHPGEEDTFDVRRPARVAEQNLADYAVAFDPEHHFDVAAAAARESDRFRFIGIVFLLGFFFLSLAELIDKAAARGFVALGGVTSFVGVGLWVVG